MFEALTALVTSHLLLYLLLGSILGLVVGVLPALGGAAGLSLMIPFLFGMDPAAAMAMAIGLLATVSIGDTITSILLGIPGSASSQATVLDGFPMAKAGEGSRALSAAFLASLIGGLFGAALLTATLQVARQIVLWFGVPEILMMILFGVASVAALSGRSLAKGIAICAFGMIMAAIGFAPATGEARMTLGSFYLYDGLPLIACVIGVFVIPEIVDLVRQNRTISDRPVLGAGMGRGIRDVLQNKWIVLRSSSVGCLVGAMPGVGGAVVDWIVYGQTVRAAKDKSRFGKGDVRGVIGVESSNNAVLGGALVPTLMFGVPGSGSMALLLAALIMLGIQPGPAMVGSNIGLTYTMIWSLAIANIVGAGLCFLLARQLARITLIPFVWIAPFLLVAISFATLQINRDPRDLMLMLIFGAIGVFMRRFGYSRAAFLIGFVLAGNLERSFYQTTQLYGLADLVTRPIVLILLAAILTMVVGSVRAQLATGRAMKAGGMDVDLRKSLAQQLVLPLGLAGVFGLGLWLVAGMQPLGRLFPQTVAVVGLAAALLTVFQLLRARPSVLEDQERTGTDRPVSLLRVAVWLSAAVVLLVAFGFFAGGALFMVLFLAIEARARPAAIALSVVAIMGLYLTLTHQSGTFLPDGWVLALNPWNYF